MTEVMRIVVIHLSLVPALEEWLAERGLKLGRVDGADYWIVVPAEGSAR